MVVCACQVFVDLRACERAGQRDRYIVNQTIKESATAIGRERAPANMCETDQERDREQ